MSASAQATGIAWGLAQTCPPYHAGLGELARVSLDPAIGTHQLWMMGMAAVRNFHRAFKQRCDKAGQQDRGHDGDLHPFSLRRHARRFGGWATALMGLRVAEHTRNDAVRLVVVCGRTAQRCRGCGECSVGWCPAGRADQRDGTRFDRAEGALLPTAFRARAENLYRPAGSLNTRDRAVGGILGDVVRAITVFVALIRRAVST